MCKNRYFKQNVRQGDVNLVFYLKLVSMRVEMDPFGAFEPNWSKKKKKRLNWVQHNN